MPVQHAPRYCACGCGQRPRNWKAIYVAGHRPLIPLAERLWSRISKTETGCWEFTGFCHPTRGYGQLGRGRKSDGLVEAHRAAWEVTYGSIPEGMVVRHKCDNPPCCNPEHLELGTHQQNSNDKTTRRRQARRSQLPQTKLTDADVVGIRAAARRGELQRQIAARYGISQGHVSGLVAGDQHARSAA